MEFICTTKSLMASSLTFCECFSFSILTLNSSGVHLIYLNKHDSKLYFCFSVLFVRNRNMILKQVNHAPFMFQIASKMMALEESARKHTQKLKPTLWGSNPYSSLYSNTYNIKCFGSHDSQSTDSRMKKY